MKAAIMLTTALLAGDVAPADARSGPVGPSDTLPTVTLAEALRRATRLDPDYVRALGQIDNAEWSRRAARLAFILPAVTAEVDATRYSTEFFNVLFASAPRISRSAIAAWASGKTTSGWTCCTLLSSVIN